LTTETALSYCTDLGLYESVYYDFDENCSCNLKAKPWLGPNCETWDPLNPDHSCRIYSFYEHNGDLSVLKAGNDNLSLHLKNCESARQLRCAETELLRQQAFNSIVGSMLNIPIHQAFLKVASKNADIRQRFDMLSDQMQQNIKTVSTEESLTKVNILLLQDMRAIQPMFKDLSALERQLDVLLDRLAGQLAILDARTVVTQHGFDCTKLLPNERASYSAKENDVYALINRYRDDARSERRITNRLYNAAYFSWRYLVYKKYAESVGAEIEDVMHNLNGDLAVEQLIWQYADWWTNSSVNGLAGNLHTRYYFYTEPLRILKSLREEALGFKERLKIFEKNNSAAVQEAYKTINANIATIDRGIVFINSKGWSGLLALQIQSAKKRASLVPANQKCQELTQRFVDRSAKITDVDAFDKASYLYKETVSI
jgi:hypothetical protein